LGQLKALSKIGKVTVFTLNVTRDAGILPNIEIIETSAKELSMGHSNLELIRSFSTNIHNLWSFRSNKTSISEFLETANRTRPDYMIFSRLEMASYIEAASEKFDGTTILDLDESIETLTLSMQNFPNLTFPKINQLINKRLIQFEVELISQVSQVWLSSKVEFCEFEKRFPLTNWLHVPNVIDTNLYFRPEILNADGRLVFMGNFNYKPNQQGLSFVLNELMPLLPHKKLKLLGSGLESFNNFGNIEFVQNPISMSQHLSQLDVALIPIFVGAGTRLKALEAMAFGLPIVSTKKGVEGLELDPWVQYVPAETAQEFVEAINHLDANSKFADELSFKGIKLVSDRFSVDSLAGHLQGHLVS